MEQKDDKQNNGNVIIWVLLIIVTLVIFYFYKNQKGLFSHDKATIATFEDMGRPLSEDIINCEFRVTSIFIYKNKKDAWSDKNRKIYYHTSEDTETSLITFTNLSTENPKIKGNVGDAPLKMLKNDEETIVLEENNMVGDIFIYTINLFQNS